MARLTLEMIIIHNPGTNKIYRKESPITTPENFVTGFKPLFTAHYILHWTVFICIRLITPKNIMNGFPGYPVLWPD
nr:hypothetical protein [Bathymodiolus japonicus methanotrophic gill symbiont]